MQEVLQGLCLGPASGEENGLGGRTREREKGATMQAQDRSMGHSEAALTPESCPELRGRGTPGRGAPGTG